MAENLYDRKPYTRAQLSRLIPPIDDNYDPRQDVIPDHVRPVGPLTVDEAMEYLERLVYLALERPLTWDEGFLHGQLRESLVQAATAAALKKDGKRYIVVSEDVLRKRGLV